MTDSAAITKGTQEYIDALKATEAVVKDGEPLAFVDPATIGSKGLSVIIKQNNYLVQITTTILRKLAELEDRVQNIEQQARRIEQGKKTEVTLPQDAVQQLAASLGKGIQLGSEKGKGVAKTGPVTAYRNPYTVYKEEQDKLKK